MNILQQIIESKKEEIRLRKTITDTKTLENSPFFGRQGHSLKNNLLHSPTGIVAEFKRKSPSRGWIHPEACPLEVVPAYEQAGAAGISVLTDFPFFGGSSEDLMQIRDKVQLPILRKDFILDEYQLVEAKSMGADVVLLIAAVLSVKDTLTLARQANALGLEVLLELHQEQELDHLNDWVSLVGVNNRDLRHFKVDLRVSLDLMPRLGPGHVCLSESGISDTASVLRLRKAGYRGFLMGENFMKHPSPGDACKAFIDSLTFPSGDVC